MIKATTSFFSEFIKKETSGGIILMLSAAAAVAIANSPFHSYYELLLSTHFEIRAGDFEIAKPLLLWINDGLMAIFFFLVGLELKREMMEGELSDKRNIILPGVGAIGGMVVPALIYVAFNLGDSASLKGWAIPAATDIAFALGILALLGSRVPLSAKIFLTSLAIFDDIGAILVIAIFYTASLSINALLVFVCCLPVLYYFNKKNVAARSPYLLVGLVMWTALLKSGVHATLAGVVLALFIPLRIKGSDSSPLKGLEHDLHHVVAFFILPVFAFSNSGLNLTNITLDQVLHGVPMGIGAGLFFGKQIGIFLTCLIAIKFGLSKLPTGMNYPILYGTSVLCGVGFTMSLFIGSLAFEEDTGIALFDERLGIIIGSLLSGILGYFLLRANLKPAAAESLAQK